MLTVPLKRIVPSLLLQLDPGSFILLPIAEPKCREGVGLASPGEGEAYILASELEVVEVACKLQGWVGCRR